MIFFNAVNNKLSNDHTSTKIGYRESQILELLIQHSPNVVKKSDIIQHAWGNQYIGETSLAKSISALRHALLRLGTKDSPIVTVPKVGYRLISDYIDYDIQKPKLAQTQPKAFGEISTSITKAIIEDEPRASLYHYRFSICYLTAFTLLFSASLLAFSKIHGWSWEESNSKHSLSVKKIGNLDVISASNTPLTPQLHYLLSSYQCHCVVYFEENDQYTELSLMDRDTRRSINIFYSQEQLNQISGHITSFLQEGQP